MKNLQELSLRDNDITQVRTESRGGWGGRGGRREAVDLRPFIVCGTGGECAAPAQAAGPVHERAGGGGRQRRGRAGQGGPPSPGTEEPAGTERRAQPHPRRAGVAPGASQLWGWAGGEGEGAALTSLVGHCGGDEKEEGRAQMHRRGDESAISPFRPSVCLPPAAVPWPAGAEPGVQPPDQPVRGRDRAEGAARPPRADAARQPALAAQGLPHQVRTDRRAS